jgi:hypothetical protein
MKYSKPLFNNEKQETVAEACMKEIMALHAELHVSTCVSEPSTGTGCVLRDGHLLLIQRVLHHSNAQNQFAFHKSGWSTVQLRAPGAVS